jgi:hypothetical protein
LNTAHTGRVTSKLPERFTSVAIPFKEIAASVHSLVALFKPLPFPPKMFCSIFIISTMTASDSLSRQCCFVSLSTLSPAGLLRPAERRVSQVALMSFGACRL